MRGYLELLWETGYRSGDPLIGDAVDVELAAEYPGSPGKLAKALLDCKFIDERPDGRFEIHDLIANAPDFVKRRARREAERRNVSVTDRPTATSDRPVTGHRQPSQDCQNRVGATNRTEQDRTEHSPSESFAATAAKPSPKKRKAPIKPRERNLLFDAIAEVTHSDPHVSGSHIGKAASLLAQAEPPYSPEEVRRLPEAIRQAGMDFTITVGALEKHIGLVRAARSHSGPAEKPEDYAAKVAEQRERSARERAAAIGPADVATVLGRTRLSGDGLPPNGVNHEP